jgi:hypothetical protein
MRKLFLLLFCAALLPAETNLERGKRLIHESLNALGGEKFLAMEDRIESGRAYSFYRERLTGLAVAKIYTRYLKENVPGQVRQRERQTFGKDEDSVILLLENDSYQITYRGAIPLKQDRLYRYKESVLRNYFYILRMRMKEPGMIFEYRGSDIWSNIPVEKVDITDNENRVVTVYLHRTTKLPVRQISVRRDPQTKERIEDSSIYTKFRDAGGGVQWPFNILSERNGEKVFELFSESVVINQNLTDELFTVPADAKILKRER